MVISRLPLWLILTLPALSQDLGWQFHELSSEFTCEGAGFGDLNGDGVNDVVAGPHWWSGPDFTEKHSYAPVEVFDTDKYSNHFFYWVRDVDADGDGDILMIEFPGRAAAWFENTGGEGDWPRHLIYHNIENESPALADVNGDGHEDIVCHSAGILCWLERNPNDPKAPWIKHDLSKKVDGANHFTHGLGVGDVNGDGRPDVLLKNGIWFQPESLEGDPLWEHQPYLFTAAGGAQMLVTDLDRDGDGDVITSLHAHQYGLSWFENLGGDFKRHDIMGWVPGHHGAALAVSELHALDLCDVNGDGELDVICGKRFKSHGFAEPGARDTAYLLWFERVPGELRFEQHIIHDDSGAGVQVMGGDVDGDGRLDVVTANKKGVFLHLQREDGARYTAPPIEEVAEGKDVFPEGGVLAVGLDGEEMGLDFETGDLRHWVAEGGAFEGQPILGDTVSPRRSDSASDHAGNYWIGGYELHQDVPTGTLTSKPFRLAHPYVAFLVGGGGNQENRVDILQAESGKRITGVRGRNDERLRPTVLDLSDYVGQAIQVQLVDQHTGHWGHINFDHLRLYAERPVFADGLEVSDVINEVHHAGLTPEQGAREMAVPDGFDTDLIAGEPDIRQPIAMCFDERGRLWVAEAHSYPKKRYEDGEDQILIFEDTDGDGSFETRKVFVSGLDLVSGLEVGYGGVFVGQAPEFLFFPDADGDDVPDGPPEVLLDGWGYWDTHETLNAFNWGPDGWLYGCHGVFTHSKVGPPGTPDEDREPINAGVWRYHPKTRAFEVFAWGSSNPWGVDFNDYGHPFITACVIPHLYHVIQGARYFRQAGEHFSPYIYDDIETIADHLHFIGDNPWADIAGSGDAGGGHAHCGAMVYLGGAWPEKYDGTLFMFNIHGNRMNNELLEPSRSGYIGRHMDDFLFARDRWFRGINLRYGPDGQVYFIDWYDQQACHHNTVEVWNRGNGRLYRVRYGDHEPVQVDLTQADEAALLELTHHDNDWYVRMARRLLGERGVSEGGRARLAGEVRDSSLPVEKRLRSLWALHTAAGTSNELLLELLDSREEHLRSWAVQLACESGSPSADILAGLERLAAGDPSPVVRLYLSSALQRLPKAHRWGIARGLVSRAEDAGDPNLEHMIWYGIEPLVPENPRGALTLARQSRLPLVAQWIRRRAAEDEGGRDSLVDALRSTRDRDERAGLLEQALVALADRRGVEMPAGWTAAYTALTKDSEFADQAVVLAATFGDPQAYPTLRAWLGDPGAEHRSLALDTLVRGRDPLAVEPILALLAEPEMRSEALKALANFDDPSIASGILRHWSDYDEAARRDAVSTLTSRAPGVLALLDGMAAGNVDRTVFSAFELRKITELEDEEVDARMREVWGVVRRSNEDKAAQIAKWKERLTEERLAAADRSHGRDVYARTCARCHTLFGEGEEIGPDITGANRGDLDYLLTNMVDPSAIIPVEYQVTIVFTTDGRVLTGILTEERDDVVVLQTENERVVVARDEIETLRPDPNSMMPNGQLDLLSEDEVAALVAYLMGDTQVPRRAPKEAKFFDGTLDGWVGDRNLWTIEDGEIVGRSEEGLPRNAFLLRDLDLGDFRLAFEVKLTPDSENSGVQFRSHPHGADSVFGYQADIGVGWWGNLYDEHGRGLLVNAQDVAKPKPNEWNHYEIHASGRHVRTWLNGELCVDFQEPDEGRERGQVALQMHSGGPLEVRFRAFELTIED